MDWEIKSGFSGILFQTIPFKIHPLFFSNCVLNYHSPILCLLADLRRTSLFKAKFDQLQGNEAEHQRTMLFDGLLALPEQIAILLQCTTYQLYCVIN